MPLSERDAARTVSSYVEGLTLDHYLEDRKLQLAIERLIEIIGGKRSPPDRGSEPKGVRHSCLT